MHHYRLELIQIFEMWCQYYQSTLNTRNKILNNIACLDLTFCIPDNNFKSIVSKYLINLVLMIREQPTSNYIRSHNHRNALFHNLLIASKECEPKILLLNNYTIKFLIQYRLTLFN